MKLFRTDNTEGYSDEKLDSFNAEWQEIVEREKLEENTEAYDIAAKFFSDVVARR